MVREAHCERASSDPNFPPYLDIHPSAIPVAHHTSFAGTNELETNFGCAAQELAIKQYGIAGRVWEAAYAMLLYIQPPRGVEFDPPFDDIGLHISTKRSMVELGSGSGMVASTLTKILDPIRDHLIATDLPEVCPLLRSNLCPDSGSTYSGKKDTITVLPLSWGEYEDAMKLAPLFTEKPQTDMSNLNLGPLTHIICSDLIYFPELLAPLLRSLLHLTSPPFVRSTIPETDCTTANKQFPTVVISYKLRSLAKETRFWSAFGLWFDFTPVLVKERDEDWKRFGSDMEDATFLFIACRRPESYCWNVALLDEHLLSGIGAQGTDTPKGDDAFEGLLLMSLDQS